MTKPGETIFKKRRQRTPGAGKRSWVSAPTRPPGFGESIALMGLMISFVALSVDMMIPALPRIAGDLHVTGANDVQLVISALVMGLTLGQLLYGPVSDTTGRRPAIFAGVFIFVTGCLMSILATAFPVMLVGRFLQGMGAAGPRSVIVAMIRDQHDGRAMARLLSFMMGIFIVVPAVAPTLGQAVLLVAGWRSIFGVLMTLALVTISWFFLRQPETLPRERRLPFSFRRMRTAAFEILTHRVAMGYTVCAGCIMGAFLGYLSSAQQIFQEIYGLGRSFSLYLGAIALFVGAGSILNSRLVMRWGMRRLTRKAIYLVMGVWSAYFLAALAMGGVTPLWMLMACFMIGFFCMGVLFGNLNTIAMQPLGHIAGIGAALVGSLAHTISLPPALLIGQCFDGTLLPFSGGFALLSMVAAIVMHWADRPRASGSPEK